jgi:glycosyltransferase involved in cell wall biosynthesis
MDLLAVPSVNEGLSNAVLEALACGIPVLAHGACGNAEVIRHNQDGFLADLSTADLLTDELEKIMASPEVLPRLAGSARQRAVENFSLDSMVSQYRDLYREVARKN